MIHFWRIKGPKINTQPAKPRRCRQEVTLLEHEQVNEKMVALSIKAMKLTGRALAKAMRAYLQKAHNPNVKQGRQSIKSLTKQGASLSNIEISDSGANSFQRVARQYNVDFAVKKDKSESPPKWIVFFKAKDAEAMSAAFNEYSKKTLAKAKKPSLSERLDKLKELTKNISAPVKNRTHGEREL
jgi:hypothetical protein